MGADEIDRWEPSAEGLAHRADGPGYYPGRDFTGRPNLVAQRSRCVPADAPGPDLDFTGQILPSPVERPATWTAAAAMVLPEGVQPTAVRVMWNKPGYVKLTLPR